MSPRDVLYVPVYLKKTRPPTQGSYKLVFMLYRSLITVCVFFFFFWQDAYDATRYSTGLAAWYVEAIVKGLLGSTGRMSRKEGDKIS